MTGLAACTCTWVHSAVASAVYLADADCPARPHPNQVDPRTETSP